MFESSVISYGSKTTPSVGMKKITFESSVISYGSSVFHMVEKIKFEEWIKTGRPLN